MARMRTIKPETFTSETLADCSVCARWTFAGLWTYCDDEGRGRGDPRLVKAAVWPLDDDVTAKDVAGFLDDLEAARLICRYEAGGKQYLHVVNFGEHQKPNRPVPSKLPACSRRTHGGLSEDAVGHQVTPSRHVPDVFGPPQDAGQGLLPPEAGDFIDVDDDFAGQAAFSEDSVSSHGAVTPTSFTNTPSTSPVVTNEGDGDGDGDGEVEPAKPPRDDVERLCTHLADRIEGNGSKRPSVGAKWRDAARLMLDRDGRSEQQIHAAIDWSQDSEFWRVNILSMPKLREKYEQLRLQAQRDKERRSPPSRQEETDGLFDRAMERARAREEAGHDPQ